MRENVFSEFKRPPILLIGSGISRRYVEGFSDWKGLLSKVAGRIGVDDDQFIAFINDAKKKCGDDSDILYPTVCDDLESELNGKIKSNHVVPRDFFTEPEYCLYRGKVNPMKILVASALGELKINPDSALVEELELFKQVANVIPCVVTTNYDKFLEDVVFDGKFAVYSDVSDYYDSDSQGIGEIYKIHGSIDNPSSLILNVRDYESYRKRSDIVSANIMSTLCDYPLVIMGYSFNDSDVRDILKTMARSLNEEKLRKMERNIVYVSYVKGENDFITKPMNFGDSDNKITVNAVETDNFKGIFREILKMTPSTSPALVRKFRQMVKKIIITSSSEDRGYILLGVGDESLENMTNPVIALGERLYIDRIKSIPISTVDSMVKDILYDKNTCDPKVMVEYFIKSKNVFQKRQYVPIYYYAIQIHQNLYGSSDFFREYTDYQKSRFDKIRYPFNLKKFILLKNVKTAQELENAMIGVAEYKLSKIV